MQSQGGIDGRCTHQDSVRTINARPLLVFSQYKRVAAVVLQNDNVGMFVSIQVMTKTIVDNAIDSVPLTKIASTVHVGQRAHLVQVQR